VAVPAGEHTIEFEYICPAFRTGSVVSAVFAGVAVLYLCYALWRGLPRRRPEQGRAPASQEKQQGRA
jgi:uncharacterized protein (DUF2062 family)